MSTRAMNWAFETMKGSRLTAAQRLALIALAHHHHDKTNACFPSMETIAAVAGLTVRRAQIAVRALEKMGLISVAVRTEHGRQRSNQYDLFGKMRGDASVAPKARARNDASVAPKTRARDDASVAPKTRARGDGGDAPQNGRGATLASPDREYLGDRARQSPSEIIAFPRAVGGD